MKLKRKKIIKEELHEGYGSGFSFTGGTRGSLSRGGFGGASNLGGPNMMYTYEIKPLNHTLEPKPSDTLGQKEQLFIGCKVTGTPIASARTVTKTNNTINANAKINIGDFEPDGIEIDLTKDSKKIDKKVTGILQSTKLAADGVIKYYVVFDEATATPVKIEPTSIKLIVEEPIKYFADATTDTPSQRRIKMERMAKNRKLVSESFQEFQKKIEEGIADKYGEKMGLIDNKEIEFNRKFNKEQITQTGVELVGILTKSMITNKDFTVPINVYKNPKTLKNFGIGVRGVITKNGDLYLADNANAIHYDITELLEEKNIIPKDTARGWEDMRIVNFITVQRVAKFNVIAIGESYKLEKILGDNGEREESIKIRNTQISKFIPFLNAAAKNFPQYKFPHEQTMRVLRQMVSPEERRKIFASMEESIRYEKTSSKRIYS